MRIFITAAAMALTSTPALAIDPCLTGNWQADLNDLGQMIGGQMGGSVTVTDGTIAMMISTDDNLTMTISDLRYNMQMPDIPATLVTINGISSAAMMAEGGSWTATNTDFDLVASADVMGQTMVIPFDSDTGLFGGGDGTYECAGDTVTFISAGDVPRMPRQWVRID